MSAEFRDLTPEDIANMPREELHDEIVQRLQSMSERAVRLTKQLDVIEAHLAARSAARANA